MAGSVQASPGVNLTPAPSQVTLPTNYITDFDFLSQYLPDTYEKEFEKYGNRSVASFLRLVGAEIPSTSDMIKWTEQGRLHTKYEGVTANVNFTQDVLEEFTIASGTCTFRVGQTVLISDESSTTSRKAVVTAVGADTTDTGVDSFRVAYYTAGDAASPYTGDVTVFAYGSEFRKGSAGMVGALEAESDIYENKPIIIKDKYEVAGSDMAQIGWVEVTTENGATGYLWYLKSEHETRLRFEDYLEMAMVEGQQADDSSGAEAYFKPSGAAASATEAGTQGMFDTIEDRGNIWSGGNPTAMSDWDAILKRLDKQGSIRENVLFNERDMSLDIDDMLAAQNSYGAGGTSYGMFNNSEEMALNLGFDGFKRGSYEFYKTDWKYLNDATLRGGIVGGKVNGVLVPAGTTTVYDQVLGKNAKRPFLHVRYRASQAEDRRYKTWMLGSAGGAQTSDIDKMEVHFLSERALCTMGANNFFLFKD
jgi:hypothetical protein